MRYNPHVQPGVFELFCGPMYSGKTMALHYRLMPLEHMEHKFVFIRPTSDRRPARTAPYESVFIEDNNPAQILSVVSDEHLLVAIDEIEFFGEGIIETVGALVRKGRNVVASGLDLNFRGEPFGQMAGLMAIADEVMKCKKAICRYNNCGAVATRTQRIIHGAPAVYDSPVKSVEGSSEHECYEPRCIQHHFVPGKPAHL